ncbi:hypothetical protein PIB30_030289 [Stylosanthes scabra]|uniref:Uncharacterized protein n=1 Tax=Stylosanthes scabra TaxID=79078 RepID=A0ABU6QAZ3_9FABA|nr:hypothetical protein [Stylosanthes scabra]
MLGRGIHTLIRHASFSSPIDLGLQNPPPKGAQHPRWHIDPSSSSDTTCNSSDHPLTRYCPLWHTRPHGFAFDDRDDSRSPHSHSSKRVKLGRGIHTLIRHDVATSPHGMAQPVGVRVVSTHVSFFFPLREPSVPDGISIRAPTLIPLPKPHTPSSKSVILGRGIHTLIRHASFSSPTDVGLHDPPPKGAQRPRWHIDLSSGSDTTCNSPYHPLGSILSALAHKASRFCL